MIPAWTTALPDWERRIVARESLIPCAPLFPEQAEEGLQYFRELRAVDVGAHMPTMGDIARPWITDWVASIFGAYDAETGRRMIREWFLLISKKNGKSTTAGLLMLSVLLLNWRPSGEFGILAPTVEVANNAFKPAADAVRADDELKALLHVQDHIRTITHLGTKATLQVVAAESETVAGKKWIGTFVDELWLFGKRANAMKMLEEATGGMASRPEGFVIYASTQSDEEPAGVFKDKLDYARRVRDGEIVDPQFLPVLYEYPNPMVEAEAYLEEGNFYVTNPNMGASVDEEFIRRKMRQIGEAGQETKQVVLAKYLNVQIGQSLSANRWSGADFWERRGVKKMTLDAIIARSDCVVVGVDGGGLDDLLGLAVLGRDKENGDWLHWGRAWAHPMAVERRKSEESRYRDFQRDGDLEIVESLPDDVSGALAVVKRIDEAGLLGGIGLDPERTHKIMLAALIEAGIDEKLIVGVSQGWRLFGAMTVVERKLAEGTFWHGARPLMAWCMGNCKVEPKGNAMLITKQVSGRAKIDPVMAMLNCAELMARNPAPVKKKYQMLFV